MKRLTWKAAPLLIAVVSGLSLTIEPGRAGEDEAARLAERLLRLHREYRPRSMLQTPEHPVSKPRFLAVDVHSQWNPEVDPAALVADMARLGIAYAVNLSGGWGDRLEGMLERYERCPGEGLPPERGRALQELAATFLDAEIDHCLLMEVSPTD